MMFKRKGSQRDEGILVTEGDVRQAAFHANDKAVHFFLSSVPNFNKGSGTHDWEVVLSMDEIAKALNAIAEADQNKRRWIAAKFADSTDSLRFLLDLTEKHQAQFDRNL